MLGVHHIQYFCRHALVILLYRVSLGNACPASSARTTPYSKRPSISRWQKTDGHAVLRAKLASALIRCSPSARYWPRLLFHTSISRIVHNDLPASHLPGVWQALASNQDLCLVEHHQLQVDELQRTSNKSLLNFSLLAIWPMGSADGPYVAATSEILSFPAIFLSDAARIARGLASPRQKLLQITIKAI